MFACLRVVFGSDCVCCFGGLVCRLGYVGMLVCRLLIVLSSLWWIGVRFGFLAACCFLGWLVRRAVVGCFAGGVLCWVWLLAVL